MPAADITPELEKYSNNIIPCISLKEIDTHHAILKKARLVAIEYSDEMLNDFNSAIEKIKKVSNALTIIRVPAVKDVESIVSRLAQSGAEIIHIVADYRGREVSKETSTNPSLIKDIIRAVHLRLVDDRIRDEITLIASGGIAMAEHVPKAMLCGADLTAIDIPLMIALGARIYEEPEKLLVFPEGLDKIPGDNHHPANG